MYTELSYDEYLAKDLKVADAAAISLARDNALKMVFFNLSVDGNIRRAAHGEQIGTTIVR